MLIHVDVDVEEGDPPGLFEDLRMLLEECAQLLLTGFTAGCQILGQELELDGEQSELMQVILDESLRLERTIREFLLFARPGRFQPEQADLAHVLHQRTAARGHPIRHAVYQSPGFDPQGKQDDHVARVRARACAHRDRRRNAWSRVAGRRG